MGGKAVGKLPFYGLISSEIPLTVCSASDGEQEEVCEVLNQMRLELMRWEQRADLDFHPQSALAASWQT